MLVLKVVRAVKVHKAKLDPRDLEDPKVLLEAVDWMVLRVRLVKKDQLEKTGSQELTEGMECLASLE